MFWGKLKIEGVKELAEPSEEVKDVGRKMSWKTEIGGEKGGSNWMDSGESEPLDEL